MQNSVLFDQLESPEMIDYIFLHRGVVTSNNRCRSTTMNIDRLFKWHSFSGKVGSSARSGIIEEFLNRWGDELQSAWLRAETMVWRKKKRKRKTNHMIFFFYWFCENFTPSDSQLICFVIKVHVCVALDFIFSLLCLHGCIVRLVLFHLCVVVSKFPNKFHLSRHINIIP